MIEKYIAKIVDKGKTEDMKCLGDMLTELIEDSEYKDKYEMKLYIMSEGKILTDEMKRNWVKNMNPMAKWTEEEIKNVVNSYDLDIPITSAYVIFNMLYSDMKGALGNGEDEESIRRYAQATQDWYYDKDATKTQEEKLFEYYFHIVK